jgi:hypothetical protein
MRPDFAGESLFSLAGKTVEKRENGHLRGRGTQGL